MRFCKDYIIPCRSKLNFPYCRPHPCQYICRPLCIDGNIRGDCRSCCKGVAPGYCGEPAIKGRSRQGWRGWQRYYGGSRNDTGYRSRRWSSALTVKGNFISSRRGCRPLCIDGNIRGDCRSCCKGVAPGYCGEPAIKGRSRQGWRGWQRYYGGSRNDTGYRSRRWSSALTVKGNFISSRRGCRPLCIDGNIRGDCRSCCKGVAPGYCGEPAIKGRSRQGWRGWQRYYGGSRNDTGYRSRRWSSALTVKGNFISSRRGCRPLCIDGNIRGDCRSCCKGVAPGYCGEPAIKGRSRQGWRGWQRYYGGSRNDTGYRSRRWSSALTVKGNFISSRRGCRPLCIDGIIRGDCRGCCKGVALVSCG